jgi:hypothetical protein
MGFGEEDGDGIETRIPSVLDDKTVLEFVAFG